MADRWSQSEFRTQRTSQRKTDPKSEMIEYCTPRASRIMTTSASLSALVRRGISVSQSIKYPEISRRNILEISPRRLPPRGYPPEITPGRTRSGIEVCGNGMALSVFIPSYSHKFQSHFHSHASQTFVLIPIIFQYRHSHSRLVALH